jgi:hypothetical protein
MLEDWKEPIQSRKKMFRDDESQIWPHNDLFIDLSRRINRRHGMVQK